MLHLMQNEAEDARRRIPIRLVDTSGSAVLGATPTGQISKQGLLEATVAGTFTEIAGGLYYYQATVEELDTLGFLTLRVEEANAEDFVAVAQVIEPTTTSPSATEIADVFLNRRISGGASGIRTVGEALAAARNRVEIVDDVMRVYDVDDSTVLWEASITTAEGDPVRGIDPS